MDIPRDSFRVTILELALENNQKAVLKLLKDFKLRIVPAEYPPFFDLIDASKE